MNNDDVNTNSELILIYKRWSDILDYWRNNTIWFDDVPDYLYADIDLNNETVNKRELGSAKIEEKELGKIKYLTLWNYKKNNVGVLDDIPEELIYLEMNRSNIENFKSIENFRVKTFRTSLLYKITK